MLSRTVVALAAKPQQAGTFYGGNDCCDPYISVNYHRNGTPKKSQWLPTFNRHQEYLAFCVAQQHGWTDETDNLWSIQPSLTVIGTAGERIAYFVLPQDGGPWHGYPITTKIGREQWRYRPPKDVIKSWINNHLITSAQAARIRRLKV